MAKKTIKQPKPIIISDEDFFTNYKPIINHIARANATDTIADNDIAPYAGTMYETFGKEVEHIVMLANHPKTKNKVWTIVDGDEDPIVIAGYHLVNRIGYIVTEKPWVTGTEEVPYNQ